jgi:hypothetical protein
MSRIPTDSEAVIDIYRRAADENRSDPLLKGATLQFPNYGQLVMTGDMHGHMRNFDKLVKFCVLGQSRGRHVILHELIHREPERLDELDMSHELCYEAAHWKVAFPEQVHFLQSNHELAQVTGQEITKNGRSVTRTFEEGVGHTFGRNNAAKVLDAICEFISSFPLAGRTANGFFLSHSLPSDVDWPAFDPTVLERTITERDLMETGSVYSLVWGRRHSEPLLDQIAETLGVEMFINGHQPQEEGMAVVGHRQLIIASDHNHGVFLPIDLRRSFTMPDLVQCVRKYVSVA